jgi:hypothetical protein
VWITQADDPDDIILHAGESVLLDKPGLAVVMALKDASIMTAEPVHLPRSTAQLLRKVLTAEGSAR